MDTETLLNNSTDFHTRNASIKVVIVDDNRLFVDGISRLLNEAPGIIFCASFLNGNELLDWYNGPNADVILLEIHMSVLNGVEASKQILARFPAAKIIILSVDDDPRIIRLMYESGVCAYLTKNANHENLIDAILKVQAGEKVFNESVYIKSLKSTSKKSNNSKFKLTDREVQILKLIVKGRTNLQIAADLYLSPFTIKTHRQNLLCKLQVSNTAQLIAKANLSGLLKLNDK